MSCFLFNCKHVARETKYGIEFQIRISIFILTNHIDIVEVVSSMTNHASPHLIGISIDPLRTAPLLDGGAHYQFPLHHIASSALES